MPLLFELQCTRCVSLFPLQLLRAKQQEFAVISCARNALRVAAVLAAALLLSGCVIVPGGPGYYHPHRVYWGY
jgi:hypothetical protein